MILLQIEPYIWEESEYCNHILVHAVILYKALDQGRLSRENFSLILFKKLKILELSNSNKRFRSRYSEVLDLGKMTSLELKNMAMPC